MVPEKESEGTSGLRNQKVEREQSRREKKKVQVMARSIGETESSPKEIREKKQSFMPVRKPLSWQDLGSSSVQTTPENAGKGDGHRGRPAG